MAKRLVDIVISILLIPPALVVCSLAAVAIWLDMKANPLFIQERVGRRRRPFRLVKMRTMPPATPHLPSHEVGGAAISKTGTWLRRLKIDELPQLWCVLRGDMSLVGPRPCLASQIELIEEREKHGVFDARPGITGLAQIRGVDMSTPAKLATIDADYVGNRTMTQDFEILLLTVTGSGRGDAAA
ncbi:MAG: sugar transferase [Sphingopyxis sp.]|nr:sugar transferase [Sphingopyxis sp.]